MAKDAPELVAKLSELSETLKSLALGGRFALAYSGGLDSRFLAHFAVLCGLRPLLLHVRGPHIPQEDTREAQAWAAQAGLELILVESDPLALPNVRHNEKDRCYHCKKQIMSLLRDRADKLPFCDGSNLSDSLVYRPGLAALEELHVLSPLKIAGLSKPDIKQAAHDTGLSKPWQPARPCLLTRFPYQIAITAQDLRKVGEYEEIIRRTLLAELPEQNLPQFRLRLVQGRWELHLPNNAEQFLRDHGLMDKLAGPGLSFVNNIRFMDNLSGFFDA